MIWLFSSLAVVAVYLLAGWRLALRDLPAAWERARHAWCFDDSIRGSVKAQVIGMVLLWPWMVIYRQVNARLTRVVERRDPVELARQLKERDRHIADLERELGIDR